MIRSWPVPRRWRSPILIVALLAVVMMLARPPAALAQAVSVDEYLAALDRLIASLEAGDPAEIANATDGLRQVQSVTISSGDTLEPEIRDLLRALDQSPPDGIAALLRARAIRSAVAASGSRGGIAAEAAEAHLRRVLARPELQPAPPLNPVLAFVNRLVAGALQIALEAIFAFVRSGVGTILLALIGLAVIGFLAYWVPRQIAGDAGRHVAGIAVGGRRIQQSAAELRADSERLAASGDFRAAIGALYLATLRRWEEAGRLRFDRALTNREVLAVTRAAGDAALVVYLEPLVRRFDRFWYAGAPGNADEYRAFVRLAAPSWEVG